MYVYSLAIGFTVGLATLFLSRQISKSKVAVNIAVCSFGAVLAHFLSSAFLGLLLPVPLVAVAGAVCAWVLLVIFSQSKQKDKEYFL